jgi:uncharacterized damage-inducible protein DinB
MQLHSIQELFDFNYWANGRVLTTAEQASPAQLNEVLPGSSQGILGIMIHVMGAEWVWRQRVQAGISPAGLLSPSQFTTLDLLRDRWREEEQAFRDYLATLHDADLVRVIEYKNTRGEPFAYPLWQILTHIVTHGMQHRSEAALMLTSFGFSPGELDFLRYQDQKAG